MSFIDNVNLKNQGSYEDLLNPQTTKRAKAYPAVIRVRIQKDGKGTLTAYNTLSKQLEEQIDAIGFLLKDGKVFVIFNPLKRKFPMNRTKEIGAGGYFTVRTMNQALVETFQKWTGIQSGKYSDFEIKLSHTIEGSPCYELKFKDSKTIKRQNHDTDSTSNANN